MSERRQRPSEGKPLPGATSLPRDRAEWRRRRDARRRLLEEVRMRRRIALRGRRGTDARGG